jgi:predicted alpha-1,6-mannanase (GH76 family)
VFEGPSVLAGISAGQPVAAATAVIINDWFHNVAMQHDSVICEGIRKRKHGNQISLNIMQLRRL